MSLAVKCEMAQSQALSRIEPFLSGWDFCGHPQRFIQEQAIEQAAHAVHRLLGDLRCMDDDALGLTLRSNLVAADFSYLPEAPHSPARGVWDG